jgi:hypothetical protein
MRAIGSFLPMIALMGLQSVLNVTAVARGVAPPHDLLTEYSAILFVLLWMATDARRRRYAPCHEFGFLLGVYLPISLVWYLLWSRGWRGLLPLATFIGLLMLPGIIYTVAYLIVHRGPLG